MWGIRAKGGLLLGMVGCFVIVECMIKGVVGRLVAVGGRGG